MNKGIRLIKRAVALVLVLLLSIESFAAIVSDNDGSAFITKGEFDSLKNSFQNQIDQYNTSIDSKIDGAIAAYLAGIRTIRQESVAPYVSNYNDIKWYSDWKIYGNYKTWSDWSTISENKTGVWFQPFFDNRMTVRTDNYNNGYLNVFNFRARAEQTGFTYIYAKFIGFSNGTAPAKQWPTTGGYQQTVPVSAVVCNYDDIERRYYLSTTMKNYYGASNYINAIPRLQTMDIKHNEDVWHFHGPITLYSSTPLVFNSVGDKQYLNYNIKVKDPNYNNWDYEFNEIIDQDSCTYPSFYSTLNVQSDASNYNGTTNAIHALGKTSYTSPYFSNDYGCHFQIVTDSGANSLNCLQYLMLGDDNSQLINIAKPVQGLKTNSEGYDMTGTFENYGTVTFTAEKAKMKGINEVLNGDTLDNETVSANGTFNVPFWPKEYLKTLDNHSFSYNISNINTYLKIGDGLPLSLNTSQAGKCKLSFDYNCYYTIGDVESEKKIKVDIKDGSFLESTSNYVDGYIGVDDTGTIKQIKNLEFTGGKVELVIPYNREQGLWLRLCPTNKTGGYYAKISNLKVENEYE